MVRVPIVLVLDLELSELDSPYRTHGRNTCRRQISDKFLKLGKGKTFDEGHTLYPIIPEDLDKGRLTGAGNGQGPLIHHEAVTDQKEGDFSFHFKQLLQQAIGLVDIGKDLGMVIRIDAGILDGRRELGHHLAHHFLKLGRIHFLFLAFQNLCTDRPDLFISGSIPFLQKLQDLIFRKMAEIPIECDFHPGKSISGRR